MLQSGHVKHGNLLGMWVKTQFSPQSRQIKKLNLIIAWEPNRKKWDYTEAKVDVTQEIEQRAQQAAQAGADHYALNTISCVQSSLSTG